MEVILLAPAAEWPVTPFSPIAAQKHILFLVALVAGFLRPTAGRRRRFTTSAARGGRIAPTQVRTGDLIFFRRPGPLQWLLRLAGDRWRHVGVVIEVQGRRWVLESSVGGHRARPLASALDASTASSICRLAPCRRGCDEGLASAALERMNRPTTYPSVVHQGLAGLLSLARRAATGSLGRSGRWLRALATSYLNRTGRRNRTLCASLVVRSLQGVCPDHPRFPNLTVPKWAAGRSPNPDPLAEHFALPDDVWQLFDPADRFDIDLTSEASEALDPV